MKSKIWLLAALVCEWKWVLWTSFIASSSFLKDGSCSQVPCLLLFWGQCVVSSSASEPARCSVFFSNFLPGSAPSALPSWCHVNCQLQQSPPALGIFCHSNAVMVQLHQLAFPSQITKLARGPASLWATSCVTVQELDVWVKPLIVINVVLQLQRSCSSSTILLCLWYQWRSLLVPLADPYSIMTTADGAAWNLGMWPAPAPVIYRG